MPTLNSAIQWPVPVLGQLANLDPADVPPQGCVVAENWLEIGGRVRVRPGLASGVGSASDRVMGIGRYLTDSDDLLVVGTIKGWWTASATALTDITDPARPLSGGELDQVLFRQMDLDGTPWIFGVNGVDTPRRWHSGLTQYEEFGTNTPAASALAVSADRLILAAGQTIYPGENLDVEIDWGAVEPIRLAETPGTIVCMMERGNLQTVVYATDAIYALIFQGIAGAPFRVELVAAGVSGPASPTAVVALPNGLHAYLSRVGEVMLCDGASPPRSLGPHIAEHLRASVNWEAAGRIAGWYDQQYGYLWFVYPKVGSSETKNAIAVKLSGEGQAAVWPQLFPVSVTAGYGGALRSDMTLADLPGSLADYGEATLADFSSWSRRQVVGTSTGDLYTVEGTTDLGEPVEATIRTGFGDGGDRTWWKTAVEAELVTESAGASDVVRAGLVYEDSAGDSYQETLRTVPMQLGQPHRIGLRRTARRLGLHVEVESVSGIEFGGANVYLAPRGRR